MRSGSCLGSSRPADVKEVLGRTWTETQISEQFGQIFDQPKTYEGYKDDLDYDQPSRHITDWYLLCNAPRNSPTRVKVLTPLPEKCMFTANHELHGFLELSPTVEKQQGGDGDHAAGPSKFSHPPVRVAIHKITYWSYDRSPTNRGIWVGTDHSWYKLKQPCTQLRSSATQQQISMEDVHLEFRAQFGLVSNIIDLLQEKFGSTVNDYLVVHAKRTPQNIHALLSPKPEQLRKYPMLNTEPFDLESLRRYPSFVWTHLNRIHSALNEDCVFMQGLKDLEKELKSAKKRKDDWVVEMTKDHLLRVALESEKRSGRKPWGDLSPGRLAARPNMLINIEISDSVSSPAPPAVPITTKSLNSEITKEANMADGTSTSRKERSSSSTASSSQRRRVIVEDDDDSEEEYSPQPADTGVANSDSTSKSNSSTTLYWAVTDPLDIAENPGEKLESDNLESAKKELDSYLETYSNSDDNGNDNDYHCINTQIRQDKMSLFIKEIIHAPSLRSLEVIYVSVRSLINSNKKVMKGMFKNNACRGIFHRWLDKAIQIMSDKRYTETDKKIMHSLQNREEEKRTEEEICIAIMGLIRGCHVITEKKQLQMIVSKFEVNWHDCVKKVREFAEEHDIHTLVKSCQKTAEHLCKIESISSEEGPSTTAAVSSKIGSGINKRRNDTADDSNSPTKSKFNTEAEERERKAKEEMDRQKKQRMLAMMKMARSSARRETSISSLKETTKSSTLSTANSNTTKRADDSGPAKAANRSYGEANGSASRESATSQSNTSRGWADAPSSSYAQTSSGWDSKPRSNGSGTSTSDRGSSKSQSDPAAFHGSNSQSRHSTETPLSSQENIVESRLPIDGKGRDDNNRAHAASALGTNGARQPSRDKLPESDASAHVGEDRQRHRSSSSKACWAASDLSEQKRNDGGSCASSTGWGNRSGDGSGWGSSESNSGWGKGSKSTSSWGSAKASAHGSTPSASISVNKVAGSDVEKTAGNSAGSGWGSRSKMNGDERKLSAHSSLSSGGSHSNDITRGEGDRNGDRHIVASSNNRNVSAESKPLVSTSGRSSATKMGNASQSSNWNQHGRTISTSGTSRSSPGNAGGERDRPITERNSSGPSSHDQGGRTQSLSSGFCANDSVGSSSKWGNGSKANNLSSDRRSAVVSDQNRDARTATRVSPGTNPSGKPRISDDEDGEIQEGRGMRNMKKRNRDDRVDTRPTGGMGRGRGRGKNLPAWMTQKQSDSNFVGERSKTEPPSTNDNQRTAFSTGPADTVDNLPPWKKPKEVDYRSNPEPTRKERNQTSLSKTDSASLPREGILPGQGRGRGRNMNLPAWMTQQKGNDGLSAIRAGPSEKEHANEETKSGPSSNFPGNDRDRVQNIPVRRQRENDNRGSNEGPREVMHNHTRANAPPAFPSTAAAPRGRGRGKNLPAWMTQNKDDLNERSRPEGIVNRTSAPSSTVNSVVPPSSGTRWTAPTTSQGSGPRWTNSSPTAESHSAQPSRSTSSWTPPSSIQSANAQPRVNSHSSSVSGAKWSPPRAQSERPKSGQTHPHAKENQRQSGGYRSHDAQRAVSSGGGPQRRSGGYRDQHQPINAVRTASNEGPGSGRGRGRGKDVNLPAWMTSQNR